VVQYHHRGSVHVDAGKPGIHRHDMLKIANRLSDWEYGTSAFATLQYGRRPRSGFWIDPGY
jgi:hypothetical protein